MVFVLGALALIVIVGFGIRSFVSSRERRRAWVDVARLVQSADAEDRRRGVAEMPTLRVTDWQPLAAWLIRVEEDDSVTRELATWLSDPVTVKTFGFGNYVDELLWARVWMSQHPLGLDDETLRGLTTSPHSGDQSPRE